MPVSNAWRDEDRRVLISTISDPWTWQEYMVALDEIYLMMDDSSGPVVSIGDYTQTQTVPSGAIAHMPRIARATRHPNFHHWVVCGVTTPIGRTAIQLYAKVYGHLDVVQTLEEALALADEVLSR